MLNALAAFFNMFIVLCKGGEKFAEAFQSIGQSVHNIAQVGEQMSQAYLEEETSNRLKAKQHLLLTDAAKQDVPQIKN